MRPGIAPPSIRLSHIALLGRESSANHWMMSSLETELKDQFESEVSPNLTKALINSVQSLKQYSARYLGTEEHSGHDYASHAKRTFHKSMRHLIGLLEKDGLDKYLTPGQKQIALNTVKN